MGFFIDSKIDKNLRALNAKFKDFPLGKDKLPDLTIELVPEESSLRFLKPLKSINEYSFYKVDDGFLISMNDNFLHLNKDATSAKIYCPEGDPYKKQFYMGYLLMHAYKYTMISNGGFIIHASTAVYKNSCICFCGLSGAGKSTQTSLWKENLNTWSINFDQPCIFSENGRYFAHGSPWSGKEELLRNCFCPIEAIVFVQQSKENSVQKLSAVEAFSLLYLNNYVYPFSPEFEQQYTENIKNMI